MKKSLLLLGVTLAFSLSVNAETEFPSSIEDVRIISVSHNGEYAVSFGAYGGMKILNLSTWKENSDPYEYYYETDTPGHGKCVSDNGIVVGISEKGIPEYWKDGEWNSLKLPKEVVGSNLATAITPDGSRICGSLGMSSISMDGDALMQEPCVWNADGDEYGMPILLPHPDKDFSGRVPQYITANDISADGKTIIGQVIDAVGMINYPIIYKEDENGEWSYEIVYNNLINPTGVNLPEFPGDGPIQPSQESFMTPEEIEAYNEAFAAYVNSQYQLPLPSYEEYMTEKEIEEYNASMQEFNKENEAWSVAYMKWKTAYQEISENSPGYLFNSILISPDGKNFGCTVEIIEDIPDNTGLEYSVSYHTWVFGIDSEVIKKYEGPDLHLSCMCNDGVALGSTSVGTPGNAFVLKDGQVIDMYSWMKSQNPEYSSWIEKNMIFDYEVYNFETGETEYKDEMLTGRGVATPDLSVMILSVENIWNYLDDGNSYIFKMNEGDSVASISSTDGVDNIYDLFGRKLKNPTASGIYIINGEKKLIQ